MNNRIAQEPSSNQDQISFPPFVLHFSPVILALFCLTLSLSNYSVYKGFAERQPGTWMSLILMSISFLLVFPVIKNKTLEPFKRKMALALTVLLGLAMMDEQLMWHEAFGRHVQRRITFLPRGVLNYTDDIIILLGAIIAGIALFYCVKIFSNKREYHHYLFCVVLIAIGHGVLDILGHRHYLWKLIWPDLTRKAVFPMLEVFGYFEEAFKLWCEWFVILFLLRFFHRQKGPLLWSVQILVASLLAVFGLWAVPEINQGIPYLVMGPTLKFIRNYHLLFSLGLIWIVWAAIAWRMFKQDNFKRTASGLLLLCPFYLLLPQLSERFSQIAQAAQQPMALGAFIGLVAGIIFLVARRYLRILLVLFIFSGVFGFCAQKITAQPVLFLKIGAVLFPAALTWIIKKQSRKIIIIAITLFSVVFIADPLWLLIAFGIVIIQGLRLIDQKQVLARKRFWVKFVILHILSVIIIISISPPVFMPNEKYRIKEKVLFQKGHQPLAYR